MNVGVVAGGSDVGLCVSGPAEALVALGAVGGDVDEVHFLSPPRVAGQLVNHGVAGFDGTRFGGGGGDGDGLNFFRFWLMVESGYLNISESVEGEPRSPS